MIGGLRERSFGFILPTIWLGFLGFPIYYALRDGGVAGVISVCLTVLFGAVYVGLCWVQSGPTYDPDHPSRIALSFLGLLGIIIVIQFILIGPTALSFVLYIIGTVMFTVPMPVAHMIAGPLVVFVIVFTLMFRDMGLVSLALIAIGIYVSTCGARYFERVTQESEVQAARAAVLDERERFARDVHDTVGHSLTVIALKADLAAKLVGVNDDQARTELLDIAELSRTALSEARATVTDLRKRTLADELPHITHAADGAGLTLTVEGDPELVDPGNRILFGWVAREAVTNVIRHAHATTITITMTPDTLVVCDDGVGMNGEFGNGLAGLTQRVTEAGGVLDVRRGQEKGTIVEARL